MEPSRKQMKLKRIIADLPIQFYKGGKDLEITGLCSHSRLVAPGNLFIAKKGSSEEGVRHIDEAIASGAAAIITDFPNPFLKEIVQLVCPEIHAIEGILANRYYDSPSHHLYMTGITGTNGKTTIAYLTKHFLDRLGIPCGMIGTIEYVVGSQRYMADRTTPDVMMNHKLLREMLNQGSQAAVMEVSSHGLVQGRVDQIDFDAAIFSNLSQDHLDYHGTMEEYALAKSRLFRGLGKEKWAIVNRESSSWEEMIADCPAQILTYGFSEEADLYAHDIFLQPEGTEFQISYKGETLLTRWSMVGRYNILNCLAAVALCLVRGTPLQSLGPLIEEFSTVPGRLEKISHRGKPNIFVDYAHTPDALENVLLCLQEIKEKRGGRIVTVFGCGGDRDRGKRPKMGAMADLYSDFTFVTSDNPRSEDPALICSEVAVGFSSTNFSIEVDRAKAIERAIESCHEGDFLLIAGKGHETYQIFAHQTISFDDRLVAQEIANRVAL